MILGIILVAIGTSGFIGCMTGEIILYVKLHRLTKEK
jgi:hypothetical protein